PSSRDAWEKTLACAHVELFAGSCQWNFGVGAGGGTRTLIGLAPRLILSQLRKPISPLRRAVRIRNDQRPRKAATSFFGGTARYASRMTRSMSSQSGSRSKRTPIQPRNPTYGGTKYCSG